MKRGESGTLYFKVSPIAPFEYYKDPAKTAAAHKGDYFTLGDVGYLDEDGYLFLTGRTAECIISGGVNIYPQEIDNELIKHPAVEDACTIGVPNEEWGEEVKSVLTLNPGYAGSDALAKDIQSWARDHLAGFKVPRTIEFVDELPPQPRRQDPAQEGARAVLGRTRAVDLTLKGLARRPILAIFVAI
ncbi:MAG: hypothetical protein WDM85_16340 [Caulobacteraceae bacterium]